MQGKTVWLVTSLFCRRKHWNGVFNTGIKPFITEGDILSYQIGLNYQGGENIRLAFLAEEDRAGDLALHARDYFQSFFSSAGLVPSETGLPVKGIFMPFPCNTIQFGLYEASTSDHHIERAISDIMLQALPENDIEEETILMTAYYLHISLLVTLCPYGGKEMAHYSPVYQSRLLTSETIDEPFKQNELNANRSIFMEVIRDISASRSGKEMSIPSRLAQWMALCKRIISEMPASESHRYLSHYINKQLGITGDMNILLNYFIYQTFFTPLCINSTL
ncbi:hypothetical protein [Dinghuibacter silviterrae]|uniref:Thiopeptide-type bacteriocin biosynthesis protein n=1 Tax=Dinghuibacter silviterrae TaxID=1539049 RepID=A0A4R8DSX1_9BACT|nr:hypothetical protein [Dinghuibacter silviterrae]TDX00978.1 hypothetical protein EDB95_2009 [Dinghuibacter silviterrae]